MFKQLSAEMTNSKPNKHHLSEELQQMGYVFAEAYVHLNYHEGPIPPTIAGAQLKPVQSSTCAGPKE